MTAVSPMTEPRIAELLEQTSRTFALAIPLLPEPCRRAVGLAYLAFRVADTLEDAASWSQADRVASLEALAALLVTGDPAPTREPSRRWADAEPTDHAGYLALMRELPELLAAVQALDPEPRRQVLAHARRTASGMAELQQKHGVDGRLELHALDALKAYCYVVAGIVGELLTELFVAYAPHLHAVAGALRGDQVAFGEALQLVNIIKDQQVDVGEGRALIPDAIPRETLIALAREDLVCGRRYVETLRAAGAPAGMVAFTQLPLELADASLAEIERHGPGAKVPRPQVMALLARAQSLLNEPNA